jgi:hypothetical protein
MVHAPGVIAWAVSGGAFKKDVPKLVEVVMAWEGVPKAAAKALVTGKVPYKVEGDVVEFEV